MLWRFENKELAEAEKKLGFYKERFRKREENGRTIMSGIKRINKDFARKMKPLSYSAVRPQGLLSNNGNGINIDREMLCLASGNERKHRVSKGLQSLLFLKSH